MADKTQCVVCGEASQIELTSATADSAWYCLDDCPTDEGILSLDATPATYAVMAPDIQESTPIVTEGE